LKPEIEENAVRITQQFRSGQAMVYDLRGVTGRLILRITGRGGADDEPPTEWRVEARTSSAPDTVLVAECAATRADALEAVGRTWSQKRTECNLPLFDWESVARAMRAVHAI
jgi:hypothetical protein